MNINELFPRLNEIYTEEGVAQIEEVAPIIEKMAAVLSPADIRKFLVFINGNYGLTYDMFRYIEENKV